MTPEREAELREAHRLMPSPLSAELLAWIDRLRAELGALKAADNPEFDSTDGAHPAWWRAHDYVSARYREELDKARRERDDLKADFESLEYDAAKVVRALDDLPGDLRAAVEALRDNGRDGWWEGK